jgi:hypothetical protein
MLGLSGAEHPRRASLLRTQERRPKMSRTTGLICAYVAIFAVVGSVLGALDHASRTNPSGTIDQGNVAIHGIAIPPFRG